MAGPNEAIGILPSSWDPNLAPAQSQHHESPRNAKLPLVAASTTYSQDPPALQYSDDLIHVSNIPLSQENNRISHQVPTATNSCSIARSAPPAHRGPPPPKHNSAASSNPEEKTISRGRTSNTGSLGRNRKDPETALGSATSTPSSPIVPQYLIPAIQRDQSPSGADSQPPVNHTTSISVSTSTESTPASRAGRETTGPGEGSLTFDMDQTECNPWTAPDNTVMSHANQDTQSLNSSSASRTSQETNSVRSFRQPVAPSTITVITARKDSISAKDLLPAEANRYSGFCKGAWRLQIGDFEKALQERQRPGSMYKAVKFWQCTRCKFEGRLIQYDKKTKDYDQQVMLADGIQFRWVFLFKSHVECKDTNPNPLRSTFGCIFCCAEGKGTPVFTGAQSLMDHLQEHRIRLPAGEVLYRMNCLIGTRAPVEADFDINIVAKEGITI